MLRIVIFLVLYCVVVINCFFYFVIFCRFVVWFEDVVLLLCIFGDVGVVDVYVLVDIGVNV